MNKNLNVKKSIKMAAAIAMIATSLAISASAMSTQGSLNTYVHYVPVLTDDATATTTTNYCYNGTSGNDLWTNTTACAWRGDTKSRNYGEFSGPWCIEGSGQSVTASIRMMDSARGYHSGGGNAGSGSCTTKWDK